MRNSTELYHSDVYLTLGQEYANHGNHEEAVKQYLLSMKQRVNPGAAIALMDIHNCSGGNRLMVECYARLASQICDIEFDFFARNDCRFRACLCTDRKMIECMIGENSSAELNSMEVAQTIANHACQDIDFWLERHSIYTEIKHNVLRQFLPPAAVEIVGAHILNIVDFAKDAHPQ
jgi:hypothetical protein